MKVPSAVAATPRRTMRPLGLSGLLAAGLCAAFQGCAGIRTRPGKAGLVWVSLRGGSFAMGSARWEDSGPIHRVTLEPFEIAKTPATNRQYRACVAAGACAPQDPRCLPPAFAGDDQPAVCLTWAQADAFARWVGGRLPSEAEWEYAARGEGKKQEEPWGDAPASCARAVISEGGYGCGRKLTWDVCSKPKGNTRQGLCDMIGDVYEWTADFYHEDYAGAPADGAAWVQPASEFRVVRGGSFSRAARLMSTTLRSAAVPGNANVTLGVRPARGPAP